MRTVCANDNVGGEILAFTVTDERHGTVVGVDGQNFSAQADLCTVFDSDLVERLT